MVCTALPSTALLTAMFSSLLSLLLLSSALVVTAQQDRHRLCGNQLIGMLNLVCR